jgi:multiple antibiotic resistance protein
MGASLEFFLLCFTALFTMINPIGVIPPYIALTDELDAPVQRRVAIKACITAFLVLVLFAFAGNAIFHFFQITTDSLKIVGGILFFVLGFDMLKARMTRVRDREPAEEVSAGDIAITPLAIPFICGPGALTMVILYMKEASGRLEQTLLLSAVAVVCLVTCLILLGGRRILQIIGPDGKGVLMRIMGLIVMVIAVEFFFSGLTPKVQAILGTP